EYMLEKGLAVKMFELEYGDIVQQILDYRLENNTNLVPLTVLSSQVFSKAEISTFIDFQEHESATLFMAYWDSFQSQYLETQAKALIHDAEFNQEGLIELSDNLISLTEHHEKHDMNTLAQETIADVIARNHRDYQNPYKTGLYDYDRLGHLEIGDLLILGGQSGHGKSRFALNLTYKWLDRGLRVGYISYEMTARACLLGLALIKENISWDKALAQKDQCLQNDEIAAVEMSIDYFKDKPLVINEFADTLPQVELLIKRHQLDVFIIDTVNELISDDAQFWLKLCKIASGYKRIAKKYECVCVMLAQLDSTPGRPTKKGLLSEAKLMKNTADKMDFIYRAEEEDPYNCPPELRGVMELFRVKGRFTGSGKAMLRFAGHSGKISELNEMDKTAIKHAFQTRDNK
ncbi:hypothetical protein LCGC14_2398910, partial [marine sediment metagenome]